MNSEDLKIKIKAELGENPDPGKLLLLLNEITPKIELPKLKTVYNCACGLEKPASAFPIVDTGVCHALYNVCKECEKESSKVSHLCCYTCKEVYAHTEPGKKDNSGFVFMPGKFYHTKHCPTCSVTRKSTVAEMLVYFKKNNIPYTL
jgi:hypothetical protein